MTFTSRVCIAVLLISAVVPAALASTRIETGQLRLEFGARGDLDFLQSCIPDCDDPAAKPLRITPPGGVVYFDAADQSPWALSRLEDEDAITLRFTNAAGDLTRQWRIPSEGWMLGLELRGEQHLTVTADQTFTRNEAHGFARLLGRTRYVGVGEEVTTIELAETPALTPGAAAWSGVRNRYWALLVRPEGNLPMEFLPPRDDEVRYALHSGEAQAARLDFYLGPVEPAVLRAADPVLPRLLYASLWEPLRWICFGLFHLLVAIHALVPHWALAIMLLSITVSFLMWPLSRTADRLQQSVQVTEARLAPRIRQIKSRFRGEEQAEQMLALYREEGVHPLYSLKSLAGIAVVIPVFIGAFDMLAENIWLAGEPFLWIGDLARPDSIARLPITIPFLGNDLNLLPFLMTALSVWASWLHQTALPGSGTSSQLHHLFLLALVFLLLFYTFPAGMVLYWTTNNAVAVTKNLLRRRSRRGT